MRWRSETTRVQVERPRADRLAAGEAEQLRRQARAAIGGLADLVELGAQRVLLADAVQKNVAVAGDQGQQIGEIVGHTADQPADRLHLFGLLLAARVWRGFLVDQDGARRRTPRS